VRYGMVLFTWGLFKKVVLADRLGLYVDMVYDDVHAYQGLPLILATYAYAFQIYFDFSGYTDMALGTARLFNISLTDNFNSPYLATSIADFWRRWHITFSRWILDYIFKPLQMQWRNGKNWGTAAALLVTFLVSGIWHGARWGFVIWGVLHGAYMACSVFYRPYQKKLHKALNLEKTRTLKAWQVFVTFNLVCFAWIFFRADSLHDAFYVFQAAPMFTIANSIKNTKVLYSLFFSLIIIWLENYNKEKLFNIIINQNTLKRWSIYYIIITVILFFGLYGKSKFIYFQF